MNRILLTLLTFALVAFSCTHKTPDGFKVDANISRLPDGNVYLKQFVDGQWVNTDTTQSKNGLFTFEGKVNLPEYFRIAISDTLPLIPVFIDNHAISISGSADSIQAVKISGSPTQEEYDNFRASLKPYEQKLDSIVAVYRKAQINNDVDEMNRMDSVYDQTNTIRMDAMKAYARTHHSSVVAAFLTWSNLAYDLSLLQLDSITSGFDSSIRSSVYVKMLSDYVATLKRVDIGQPATDFTMNDPEGKPITLSSLFGKYLLVDFWASWCGPCRQENPNVVAAYKKYHPMGFDILGVSFDKSHDRWVKAIEDDKLNWHQVSDLQFWNNAAGKIYGIRSIPSNMLLDPKGIIIGKNLRGEDLSNKLKEIFKK